MYNATSTVIRGHEMGRKLGFRTANMLGDIPDGVYCGYAELDGNSYKAVIFSGVAATLDREKKTFEVHFLHDFGEEEFYGKEVSVRVVDRLRDNFKFPNLDQLKHEIGRDCEKARETLE